MSKRQFEMKKCSQCTEQSTMEGAFALEEGSILLPEVSKRGQTFYWGSCKGSPHSVEGRDRSSDFQMFITVTLGGGFIFWTNTHTQPLTKVSQSNFTFTTSDALWHRPSLPFHFKNTLSSVNWFPTWTGWPLRSPGSSVVLRFDDRFQAGGNMVWCD